MAVACIACSRQYPESLFPEGRWILCDCGVPVALGAVEEGREKMQRLARLADRVCQHILDENYSFSDIAVERSKLREQALAWFPDCENLFDMIYESRFKRLWSQWRR